MKAKKRITDNCKHATFLIEKKLIQPLSLRERIFLKLHLVGCDVCKRYQRQSGKINEMIRQLFNAPNKDVKLDDNFKKELQDRIEEELKKN